jgi:hypothetical protein
VRARAAGKVGVTRGEGRQQEVDGGSLHSGGWGSCTGGRAGEAEEQRGLRGRRRGKSEGSCGKLK